MKWMLNITLVLLFVLLGMTESWAADAGCREVHPSSMSSDVVSPSKEKTSDCYFHPVSEHVKDMFCEVLSHTFVHCNLSERYVRYLNELNDLFLRQFITSYAMRERNLLCEKERLFPSISLHCVQPSCEYFVFALRKIII